MSIPRRFLLVLLAFGLMVVAAAPHFHHMRPRVRCAIPDRDYQFGKFSPTRRSLSNEAVVFSSLDTDVRAASISQRFMTASGDGSKQTVKSFQFVKDSTLRIDHCSIGQMSVLLHESGQWTVSLRADQNPLNPPQPLDVTTAEPIRKFTDHLQRNQFHVVVYCYASHGPGGTETLIGKPLVIPLNVRPFWVQQAKPYQLFVTDHHPHVRQYFASIDRVEIEFAYKLD